MSFPRYSKYKASGVEWLGEVPEHWEVKKIGAISSLKGRLGWQGLKAEEYRDSGPYVVSSAHFANHQIQWEECPRVSQERYDTDSAIQLATNDLLLMKDGAAMGKLAFVDRLPGPACLNSHLLLFRPVKIDGVDSYSPRFAFYFMQTGYFQEHIKVNGTGATFLGISQDAIGRYQMVLPPLVEQTAIAAFLDRETGKIDALVAEQRRLMELLKEKRQAVISHAVTRGLNPAAPMKDSGIEWLGPVPVGWVVGKLGYACKLKGGFAFAAGDFGTDGVAVVKMNNLKRGRLDLSEAARIPESSCNEGVSLCEGDLVWGMSGSTGETGSLGNFARVQAVDLPCQLNQRVGRFKPDSSRLGLDFIEQVIQTPYFYEQIMLLVTGTAQYNVSSEQVQSCIFALPPLSEQTAIVEFLKTETAKFDTLTAEAQRAIDLLQERRTALISAAVTGQIDVQAVR